MVQLLGRGLLMLRPLIDKLSIFLTLQKQALHTSNHVHILQVSQLYEIRCGDRYQI